MGALPGSWSRSQWGWRKVGGVLSFNALQSPRLEHTCNHPGVRRKPHVRDERPGIWMFTCICCATPYAGARRKPYVWDARLGRLRAIDPADIELGETASRTLQVGGTWFKACRARWPRIVQGVPEGAEGEPK